MFLTLAGFVSSKSTVTHTKEHKLYLHILLPALHETKLGNNHYKAPSYYRKHEASI